MFSNYIQWGRQGGLCFFHVTWNQKSLLINLGRTHALLVFLFIHQFKQQAYFVLGEQEEMEYTETASGLGSCKTWILILGLVWDSYITLANFISLDHCVK